MKQNAEMILYVMCWIVLFLEKGREEKTTTITTTDCSREHTERTKECVSLSFWNTWAKHKEEMSIFFGLVSWIHTTHKQENIYVYIIYRQIKKRTNRNRKRERAIEKIVNVVDTVKYVVLNVLVIIELLVMVVMIRLLFVHDDELLDLI